MDQQGISIPYCAGSNPVRGANALIAQLEEVAALEAVYVSVRI